MMNVVWAANTAQFEVRGVIRETLEPLGAIIDKVPCRWLNGRLYPARVTHSMMAIPIGSSVLVDGSRVARICGHILHTIQVDRRGRVSINCREFGFRDNVTAYEVKMSNNPTHHTELIQVERIRSDVPPAPHHRVEFCEKMRYDLVKQQLDEGGVVGPSSEGKTALGGAAKHGNVELMRLLVERGAVSVKDPGALPPSVSLSEPVARALLELGFPLFDLPSSGPCTSRICYAIHRNDATEVAMLLRLRSEVGVKYPGVIPYCRICSDAATVCKLAVRGCVETIRAIHNGPCSTRIGEALSPASGYTAAWNAAWGSMKEQTDFSPKHFETLLSLIGEMGADVYYETPNGSPDDVACERFDDKRLVIYADAVRRAHPEGLYHGGRRAHRLLGQLDYYRNVVVPGVMVSVQLFDRLSFMGKPCCETPAIICPHRDDAGKIGSPACSKCGRRAHLRRGAPELSSVVAAFLGAGGSRVLRWIEANIPPVRRALQPPA